MLMRSGVGGSVGRVLLIAAVAALLATSFPARAADGDLTRDELANGLQIWVIERHAAPIAAVQIWYRTGSLQERPGIRGLSHLFEHMMFRGSENFGPEEHHRRIRALGGRVNAFTSEDVTVYHQIVPVAGLDLVLEMEADRMGRLKLDEDVLETERQVVLEEYRETVLDDPFANLLKQLAEQYFDDHPYSYGVIGTMEDIESVTVEDCQNYYDAHYAPNRAALIVSGDVEPAAVVEMARRHFGPLPASKAGHNDPPPPTWSGPRALQGKADLPVPVSGVAYRWPPAGHDDSIALEVLSRLLSWRVDEKLTRERRLCVYVYADLLPFKQTSVLAVVGAHFLHIDGERVSEAVTAEITAYLGAGVTSDELERVRNQILLEERKRRYSVDGLARDLGNALFVEESPTSFRERLDRIAALTPAEVTEIGRLHCSPENVTTFRAEPERSSKLIHVLGWLMSTLHL